MPRLGVLRRERAAYLRLGAQQPKQIRRDSNPVQLLRLAGAGEIELLAVHESNLFEAAGISGPVEVVPGVYRKFRVQMAHLGNDLPDGIEPVGLSIGKRAQDHTVHNREHGRVGSDAER
jgi:hypothetical protein